jgi:hypothetical protein
MLTAQNGRQRIVVNAGENTRYALHYLTWPSVYGACTYLRVEGPRVHFVIVM